MDFRYSKFDPTKLQREKLIKALEELFNYLLLQTNGDVEEALDRLEQLGNHHGIFNEKFSIDDFKKHLEKKKTIETTHGGQMRLTGRGEQVIRRSSLEQIFSSLKKDAAGDHRVSAAGQGNERLSETRPFEFGDPVSNLEPTRSLANAIKRAGIDDLSLEEQDLEVYETEHFSSCATVLLVDISHSMILYGEDRITPAKQVALALTELIQTRFPKDSVHVCLFGDDAWEVPKAELPYIGVGPYHTNTRAGLRLAQEILRKQKQANRQIFMITDGKPSALTEDDGTIYKNPFGLDRRIVNKTLDEAAYCRRLGIPVTTFMITDDPVLVQFVERFTEINNGKAYYSQLDRLGSFIFADYLKNRRRRMR